MHRYKVHLHLPSPHEFHLLEDILIRALVLVWVFFIFIRKEKELQVLDALRV